MIKMIGKKKWNVCSVNNVYLNMNFKLIIKELHA